VSEEHPVRFEFETDGGHTVAWEFSYDAAAEVAAMSTSQALLEFGAKAPELLHALRKVFGE
jgi:hypothetical protein